MVRKIAAAVYLFSFLFAASSYGDPFPLMGRFYAGRAAEALVLADSIASLYLLIGILKRQRLTLWLLVAYNLFDVCNALANLALIPAEEYARRGGAFISAAELRTNTLIAVLFLVALTAWLLLNRRHFDNKSAYLF